MACLWHGLPLQRLVVENSRAPSGVPFAHPAYLHLVRARVATFPDCKRQGRGSSSDSWKVPRQWQHSTPNRSIRVQGDQGDACPRDGGQEVEQLPGFPQDQGKPLQISRSHLTGCLLTVVWQRYYLQLLLPPLRVRRCHWLHPEVGPVCWPDQSRSRRIRHHGHVR